MFIEAVLNGGFVLIVSASGEQVKEFHRRFLEIYHRFPVVKPYGELKILGSEFVNGGRVVTHCHNEKTVRGYHGVRLLILDEAARISDELFGAIRPSIVISRGRTVALSTPFGQRGWFHREWTEGVNWARAEVPYHQCPRIPQSFVDDERMKHGELWVAQEYECRFLPMSAGSPFDMERFSELVDPAMELLD